MTSLCPRPCSFAHGARHDFGALCEHLRSGHRCFDAWVALAFLVRPAWQRLDCLVRAVRLAPDDEKLQLLLHECRLQVEPGNDEERRLQAESCDSDAAAQLRESRARRLVTSYKPAVFRYNDQARRLGQILLAAGAINEDELDDVLREQRHTAREGRRALLGDLLVARKLITPVVLTHALMVQHRERVENGARPQALGEYLVVEGSISERQLERALIEQTRLRQMGRNESIGHILVRHGAIPIGALQRALARQVASQECDLVNSFV